MLHRHQGKVAPVYVSVPEPSERNAKAARTSRSAVNALPQFAYVSVQ